MRDHAHGEAPAPPQPHGHAPEGDHAHERDHGPDAGRGHPHAHAHGAHAHGAHAHGAHAHGAHAHLPDDPGRPFAIGIVLNLAFVIVEAVFGWRSGSLALLADAGHNLSDVAGLGVAWAGVMAAGLRPDARHTYGFKRASILAAFANAVLLLIAMGSLGLEAIDRMRHGAPAADGATVMAVAGVGIAVNAGTALLFLRDRARDLNVRGAFVHMAADALVSAGVVATGAIALETGWTWLDPAASLLIALVILVTTWDLLRQSLHLLFDGVPEGIDLQAVRAELRALPGVADVSDLHVWATGTTETALTAHLVLPGGAPDDAFYSDAARRLRERFRIGHVTLQVVRRAVMPGCDEPGGVARARGHGSHAH
jgi:cobalt-zinc-cadmium efflux system protein